MSINLKKYEKDMLEKWQEFINDMAEKKWILFGFLGQTEELSFYDSGDGGLEDFIAELSDGRVMYGAIVMNKPNTDITKIIFVLWQGKSVQTKMRTKVHIYNEEVKKFFKGYHLVISAQSEEDLSENSLASLLSTVSGIDSSKAGPRKLSSYGKPTPALENKEISKSAIDLDKKNDFLKPTQEEPKVINNSFQKPVETFTKKVEPPAYKPPVVEKPKPVVENIIPKSDESIQKSVYEKPNPSQDVKTGNVSAARMMFNKPKEESAPPVTRPARATFEPPKTLPPKPNFTQPVVNKTPSTNFVTPKPVPTTVQREIPIQKDDIKPQTRAQELEEIKKNNNISKLKSQIGFSQPIQQESVKPKPIPPKVVSLPKKEPGSIKMDAINALQKNLSFEKLAQTAQSYSKQDNEPLPKPPTGSTVKALQKTLSIEKHIQVATTFSKPDDEPLPKPQTSSEINVEALFDFSAEEPNELSVKEGENLTLINKDGSDWWIVRNSSGKQGAVPSSYVKISENTSNKSVPKKELSQIPVVCLFDYKGSENNELSFKKDEQLTILIIEDESWWMAKNQQGKTGLVPANYVQKVQESSKLPQPEVKEQLKNIIKETKSFEHDAVAEYDYSAMNKDELTIKETDKLKIINKDDPSWWEVENSLGKRGLVPANYLKLTKSELPKENITQKNPKQDSATEKQTTNDKQNMGLKKQVSIAELDSVLKKQVSITKQDNPLPKPPSTNKQETTSKDFLFEAEAEYDFTAADSAEMSFLEGQTLKIIKKVDSDWYLAENSLGKSGLVPINYVKEKTSKPAQPPIQPVKQIIPVEKQECLFEVEAQYDFKSAQPDELSFGENEIIEVIKKVDDTWWMGKNKQGKTGLIPVNYVKVKSQTQAPAKSFEQPLKQSNNENVAIAIYDYRSDNPDEISFKDGETLYIIDSSGKEWWKAKNKYGKQGLIPYGYVELQSPVAAPSQPKPQLNTQKYKAIYEFQNENSKEIPLKEGEIVNLIQNCDDGWCLIMNSKNEKGLVPFDYLEKY